MEDSFLEAILADCTWRSFRQLRHVCGEKRGWPALLVVLLILVILSGPICYAGIAFSSQVPDLVVLFQKWLDAGVPPLPDWLILINVTFARPRVNEAWNGIASRNPEVVARIWLVPRLREFEGFSRVDRRRVQGAKHSDSRCYREHLQRRNRLRAAG
ncbi:MAG TPA: hypothetical protein VF427_00855 [Noviherbaspirillum sp.]